MSLIVPKVSKPETLIVLGYGKAVPERFWLFDDQHGQALLTETVWRKGLEIGARFVHDPAVTSLDGRRLAELSGKYYAVK